MESIQTKDGPLRVYTEAHLHEEKAFIMVERCIEVLGVKLNDFSGDSLCYTEAVLELPSDLRDDTNVCWYYLVNVLDRSIGWAEEYDAEEIGSKIYGVPSSDYLCEFSFPFPRSTP